MTEESSRMKNPAFKDQNMYNENQIHKLLLPDYCQLIIRNGFRSIN